jgi:hypothetical protein
MSKFSWDDEEDFRDIPDEVNGTSTPPPIMPSAASRATPPAVNPMPEYYDESDDTDNFQESEDYQEDYSSVLSDARLRLEQGRLYEMIMNHDLFGGMDADPRAIKTVQRQICNFAKEQMEIMLGMRREPSRDSEHFSVDLPFNSLEVEALRDIAFKLTKGATKSPDVEKYVAPVEPRRSNGLNAIGSSSMTPRLPPQKESRRRSLQPKSPEPIKRPKVDPNLEARLRDGSYGMAVEQQYIEEAKRQLGMERERPLDKHPSQMTEEELKERNRQASSRNRQARSTSALAQPSAAQMEGMIMSRVSQANSNAGPGFQALLDIVARQPVKK